MYQFMTTRPQDQFHEKLLNAMDQSGLDALILTTPEAIFYATGYISCTYGRGEPVGTDIAVVPKCGKVKLIVSQFTQGGAELQTRGLVDVISYPTYMFIEDYFDPSEKEKPAQSNPYRTLDIAIEAVHGCGGDVKAVGVERNALSYDKLKYLLDHFGQGSLLDVTNWLMELRSIKLPWEIEVLRYGAQLTERLMNLTALNTFVGMTEADINRIWWQTAYALSGGHEIFNVRQAHSVGPDFWCTVMGRERPLQDGDLVRLDGGLTIYGYMSDLGRTFAVGETVTPRQEEIYRALSMGYDKGMSMMRPGAKMSDIFREVMKVCIENGIPNYVRGHVGHTLGLGPGEDAPIISPNCDGTLKPGMVLCFEVPYYSSANCSYNLEDTLLITEDGYELFTHFNRNLKIR